MKQSHNAISNKQAPCWSWKRRLRVARKKALSLNIWKIRFAIFRIKQNQRKKEERPSKKNADNQGRSVNKRDTNRAKRNFGYLFDFQFGGANQERDHRRKLGTCPDDFCFILKFTQKGRKERLGLLKYHLSLVCIHVSYSQKNLSCIKQKNKVNSTAEQCEQRSYLSRP